MAGREESPTLTDAFSEMDETIFETLDKLFARTRVCPSQIDLLVVSVSLFSPAPSLTAQIINRYRMRGDIKSSASQEWVPVDDLYKETDLFV